jgi:hypothetical protein
MRQPAVGIQVANMLMASNKNLSKEEALRQGFLIAQGGDLKSQQLDAKKVAEFQDTAAKLETEWNKKPESMLGNSKKPESIAKYNKWKEDKDAAIELKRKEILGPASGGLPQALLTPTGGAPTGGAAPLPPNPTPDKLTVGTVYQTAKGPAKWNGKGFEQ